MYRHSLYSVAALLVLLAPASWAQPTPAIQAVGYSGPNPALSGMAPLAVHVDGVESALGAGDLLSARFEWTFGDTGAEAVFDTLVGFGGAHVYDTPGSYTLTLTLTNEQYETASVSVPVTVLPDTRTPIHVAADGDDALDGRTPETAVRTVARVQALLEDGSAVRFRRGDTFDFTDTQLSLDGRTNVRIGAYGEGPRPVLASTAPWVEGSGASFVWVGGASSAVVVEGLRFERASLPPPEHLGSWQGVVVSGGDAHNVTVRDCDFHYLTYNTAALHVPPGEGDTPRGVLVLGNSSDVVGHYHFWGSGGGSNYTVLGNTVGNSLNGHVVRFYADRVFIYGNDFDSTGYDDAGCLAIFGHADCIANQTVSMASTTQSYVAGNVLRSRNRIGYQTEYGFTTSSWTVWEGNRHLRTTELELPTLRLYRGSHHLALRNNVFDGAQYAIRLDGEGDPETPAHDVWILNNTYVHAGPRQAGSFLELYDPVPADAHVTVANNLLVDPSYEGGVLGGHPYMVSLGGVEGFSLHDNLWQTPVAGEPHVVAGEPITVSAWLALPATEGEGFHALGGLEEGFAPPVGSAADGHAVPAPGVFADFHGRTRPVEGPWTVGAVEVAPVVPTSAPAGAPLPWDPGLRFESVTPHPVRGTATLRVGLAHAARVTVAVYDLLGRRVLALPAVSYPPGRHRIALGVEALPAGLYVCRLTTAAHAATQRLTVVR